jgi:hypothetical protein
MTCLECALNAKRLSGLSTAAEADPKATAVLVSLMALDALVGLQMCLWVWPSLKSVPPVKEPREMNEIIKVRSEYEPLIPLSVLALDLPAPAVGWHAHLAAKGIKVVGDDLGRDCVARGDARRLFDEKREHEVRQAALRKLAEQEAVEADRAWRAQLPKGGPWHAVPDDTLPAAAMLAAAKAAQPRRTPSHNEWLFGETDTMVQELVDEPAPELVEEPAPVPRMTSIDDLRVSIVLQPSYRGQYAAVSSWG